MEPAEWKLPPPERQHSTGKPAESHQSRQGPRITQRKRLQRLELLPSPHTHIRVQQTETVQTSLLTLQALVTHIRAHT